MLTLKKQIGLTLVELLIGMLIGIIVVGGGISVFTTSIKGQSDNAKLTRLNQDLRAIMDIMVRDIRRAGFMTSDPVSNSAMLTNNPFFDSTTAGATTDIGVYDSNSCIVYSYNRDNDSPPVVDSNERLGFLVSGGLLKMRKYGATNEDCSTGAEWETITEPEVEITGLIFTLASSALNATSMSDGTGDDDGDGLCDVGEDCNTCTRDGSPDPACLYVRNVTISLAGRLKDDTTVTQTITEDVRIRNDKFLAEVP